MASGKVLLWLIAGAALLYLYKSGNLSGIMSSINSAVNSLFSGFPSLGGGGGSKPSAPSRQAPAPKSAPSGGGSSGGCNQGLMQGIGVPSRLQFNNCVTVTGTVLGASGGPHYAPDGDMVFSLKLDPQFQQLVNAKNNESKYAGGIWIEAICQQANKSTEPWHKGDCAKGGPFPKFPLPKVGDKMTITGIHAIDTREGGHAEIHPVSSMSVTGKGAKSAFNFSGYEVRLAIA